MTKDYSSDPESVITKPRTRSALRRFVKRFFADDHDVEDVVQEATITTYLASKAQTIGSEEAYLYGTARNIALARLRAQTKKIFQQIEDIEESEHLYNGAGSPEEQVSADQQLRVHLDAVAQLPEKCQRAYVLRKVHGLTHKEIAQRMNISVSTVEKHLIKAFERCQNYIEGVNAVEQPPEAKILALRGDEQ